MTIRLFTIGFAAKTAEQFFGLLTRAGVRTVVDTRLYPDTQLSGFARKKDLGFFLNRLGGVGYDYRAELAPSKELLDAHKAKRIGWADYTTGYLDLLARRDIANRLSSEDVDGCCFLCAEATPHYCHRRLLAEYLQREWGGCSVQITHL